MKRMVMGVIALMVWAPAAFAAVQYDFVQTSRSDADNVEPTEFTARGVLDGERLRVDFLSGSAYPPGTYVVSTDGSKNLLFVDPTQKSYTEVNAIGLASAIGNSNIKIENLLPTVTKLDDAMTIAGVPADHYRLTLTYDISVQFRSMTVKQSVRTTIDKWTTMQFGDASTAPFDAVVVTGNPQIDELISAEKTKIKGFPLKQMVQVVTVSRNDPPRGSELRVPPSRTRTHEMTVTSIRTVQPNDSIFTVPSDFRKVAYTDQVNKSQTQVLSGQAAQ